MAPRKKAAPPPDEEIEDLEDLDLEDLADEVEDVDVEEEEDVEEDTPPRKKSKKRRRQNADGNIGSAELAEALGTSGRELRVMLRDHNVPKNENNRYEWPTIEAALEQMGFDDVEEAQEALTESRGKRLAALKERVEASRAAATKKSKKKAAPIEDDDEEDDEEDEVPPPPKRRKKKSS